MARPLVSILINNYNYGRFLGQAIDSALTQTYRDREVIVVDDGSTDDSRQVIQRYGSRIVPVLKENGGQASALNAGFAVCRGPIVCLLDSDDLWLPQKVAQTVELARRCPAASVLYHRFQRVSTDGQTLGPPRPHRVLCGSIRHRVRRSGGVWAHPPTSALSFRQEFLQQVLPIPEAPYRICADLYLVTLAPFLGPVAGGPGALTLYRLHGQNRWAGQEADAAQALAAALHRQEVQVHELNAALQRLRLPDRVRLEDHLPYRLLRYRLGEGESLLELAWLAARWPGEGPSVRAKMLLGNCRRLVRGVAEQPAVAAGSKDSAGAGR